MIGLLGKKLGMTHVYDEYGRRQAVTAIQAGPCTVIRLRSPDRDGYTAVQVGFEPLKESACNKPQFGQFKKAGTSAFRYVREFRLPAAPTSQPAASVSTEKKGEAKEAKETAEKPAAVGDNGMFNVGQQLTVALFKENELVDVTGVSIGKGFQGGMKRWHWRGGTETHGSMSHRAPGSIGSTTTPGRVVRGHHLPGHMGADQVTIQNVRIVRLDAANNLLFVQGSVPGSENQMVMVRRAVKKPGVIKAPRAFQVVVEEEEEETKKVKTAKKKS